jgi:hypothetical protein
MRRSGDDVKAVFKKEDVRFWTGGSWLRIDSSGGLLWT